jgi:hypothetical protein
MIHISKNSKRTDIYFLLSNSKFNVEINGNIIVCFILSINWNFYAKHVLIPRPAAPLKIKRSHDSC